ncbi:MAG: ferritin family protein [Promethearchaeota archaeon]
MMKQTINNLMIGFIKETQIRIRYEIYAEIAKKENLILIFNTFRDFAIQKFSNAIWFYETLQKLKKEEFFDTLKIEIENPTTYGATLTNIESLIKEEDEDWQKTYPIYINIAETEGYRDISKKLRKLAQIKRNQTQRLKMLLNLIETNGFSERNSITLWNCMACGYEIPIEDLPNDFLCPTCGHNKSYFQRKILKLIAEEVSYQKKQATGWVCMECGYEVALEELPEDWKCVSCGRSKAYFKRISLKPKKYIIKDSEPEKAHWTCLECGHEEEIDLPMGWKCPKCGSPK